MKKKAIMIMASVITTGCFCSSISVFGATGNMVYYNGEYYQSLNDIPDSSLTIPDSNESGGALVIHIQKQIATSGGGSIENPAYTDTRYYKYSYYNSKGELVYLSASDVEKMLNDYADSIGAERKTYEYDDSSVPEVMKELSKLNKESVPDNTKGAVYVPNGNVEDLKVSVKINSNIINVNGQDKPIDAIPYIKKDSNSTLVPLRFVTEALQDDDEVINWDSETKTATIYVNDKVIKFTAGSNVMYVDDKKVSLGNANAEIVGGRLYIPFRPLGEALEVEVEWDSETKTATFTKTEETTTEEIVESEEVISAELKKQVRDTIKTAFDKYEVGKENPYFKDTYMNSKKEGWAMYIKTDTDKEYAEMAVKLYDALKLACEKLNEYNDSRSVYIKAYEDGIIDNNYDSMREAVIKFAVDNNTKAAVEAYNMIVDVYNGLVDIVG